MITPAKTASGWDKREQAERAWQQVLAEVARSGFYGTAAIEVNLQDGRIQTIRRRIEQMER